MATEYDTNVYFRHKAEVVEFLKKQARKERRTLPSYLRVTLEDLKTEIERRESEQQTQDTCTPTSTS